MHEGQSADAFFTEAYSSEAPAGSFYAIAGLPWLLQQRRVDENGK